VFDAQGRLVLSLTAIGPGATFDAAPDGAVAGVLGPAATGLSRRLGWLPATHAAA
jgi:DNA-binding IclR family transcriptional regulator